MCCPEKVVVSRVAGRVSQAEATAKTSPGWEDTCQVQKMREVLAGLRPSAHWSDEAGETRKSHTESLGGV